MTLRSLKEELLWENPFVNISNVIKQNKRFPSPPRAELLMADWTILSKIALDFLRVDETAKSLRLVSDFLVVKNTRFPDSSQPCLKRGIFSQANQINIYSEEIQKSNI